MPGVGGIRPRRGYWLSLLFLGGIAWTAVAYRRFDSRPVRFLLVVSIFGDAGLPPLRSVSFVESALVRLLAIVSGGWLVREPLPALSVFGRPPPIPVPYPRLGFASLVFLLLFITRIFSPAVIPDPPNDYRSYMSEPEMDAKPFGYEHVDGPVYSDRFVRVSGPPDCILFGGVPTCISDSGLRSDTVKYRSLGVSLLDTNVTGQDPSGERTSANEPMEDRGKG